MADPAEVLKDALSLKPDDRAAVAEKLLAAMDARDRARTVDVETVEVVDGQRSTD